jgi:MFS family permease
MEARALAIGTAFGMLGMAAGPLLGGFIGPLLGLRAYFALNVLLLLAGFLIWARWGLREPSLRAPLQAASP